MIDPTLFADVELLKLKQLAEYFRDVLHRDCSNREHCDGCPNKHLCIYYRDLFIIVSKEIKRRSF